MEKLYDILTWGLVWIMFFGAFVLVTIDLPETSWLKNYRRIRYLLSAIYLLMAIANLLEVTGNDADAVWYSHIVTLWIGCSMAPALSIINITLLNSSFFSFRRFFIELIPPFVFTVIAFLVLELLSEKSLLFMGVYTVFILYYLFIMIRYTTLLVKEYRAYQLRFDNYFSESETNHLHWVLKTQVIAIVCGATAFISLFMSLYFVCAFSAFLILFYPYYAIRFINYPLRLSVIRAIVEKPANDEPEISLNPLSVGQLDEAVARWENEKMFLKTNINIEFVAKELCTNRTYLSNYINNYKKQTFKEWISDLRIAEAQRLLLAEPQLSIGEIGDRVGFSDKSNFTNRFSRNVGETPKKWREIQLEEVKQ